MPLPVPLPDRRRPRIVQLAAEDGGNLPAHLQGRVLGLPLDLAEHRLRDARLRRCIRLGQARRLPTRPDICAHSFHPRITGTSTAKFSTTQTADKIVLNMV